MQVLKDYVRNNIMSSARSEFLVKGYTKASMRDIAENAGITVGNIYRYYESKEYLFESIVEPTFNEITELFHQIHIEPNSPRTRETYLSFRDVFTTQLMKILRDNQEEMMILVKCSDGTRYKNVRSQFSDIIEAKVQYFIREATQEKNAEFDKRMISKVVSKSVVDGLTEMLVQNGLKDLGKLEKDIKALMDLYFSHFGMRFE